MDTDDELKGIILVKQNCQRSNGAQDPSQLDDKQSHSRFNYNKDDGTKLCVASDAHRYLVRGSGTLDLSEHLENPEHKQACRQSVHSHARSETGQE